MKRRTKSVEETRRRILDATLALHGENGILGTSWREIAERADVSVATVYKHFPSLDELVPACGALLESRTRPPLLEEAAATFAGAGSLLERIARLVGTFHEFYRRGEPYLEVDIRERKLPMVQQWDAHMRATREAYAREALAPVDALEPLVRAVGALLDFPVYMSFRRHGLSHEDAGADLSRVIRCLAGGGGKG